MLKSSKRSNEKRIDPGKKSCQVAHARKRAKERLGIISPDILAEITSCIKHQTQSEKFSIEYDSDQSKRIKVYQIKMNDWKYPVRVIYDKFRHSIVTFLYNEDSTDIYHYYDIFKNKISTKHDFGRIWKLNGEVLDIPGEEVKYLGNEEWVVEEGTLKSRKFKLCENEIFEQMN